MHESQGKVGDFRLRFSWLQFFLRMLCKAMQLFPGTSEAGTCSVSLNPHFQHTLFVGSLISQLGSVSDMHSSFER